MFGLVLAVVLLTGFVDRPWHRWWWPGVSAASAAPDPCAAPVEALGALAPGPGPGVRERTRSFVLDSRHCTWAQGDRTHIQLHYSAFFRDPAHASGYIARFSSGREKPIPDVGLGAEARGQFQPDGAVLRARRGNVYVEVRYKWQGDPLPPEVVRERVLAFAVLAYRAVDLR
ncbi:hypothetical protein Val02_32910 [Virgisporangium aliadipatigenens]|uniref:Uncharacterized protein n=1 Tax=Virgisporangium aliadipatigenens TaxID=741659 RepID=A0A8J4DPW7_9ACTN|nr:hypothetical protein [Virgisporangium aliadipatigenens]GIJ46405.1 hypothetical protein Val02_32910 [Virgisporangium aliadipatigenens]